MPNDDLKRNLNLAKRATPEKRLFFALAVKDRNKGTLLVSKKKITKTLFGNAKKAIGITNVGVIGTCYQQDGTLVFE